MDGIRLGDLIPWQKLEYLYSIYFPSSSQTGTSIPATSEVKGV